MTKTGILQPAKPEAPIFDIATSHVFRRWGPATASISTMLRSGRSTLRWKIWAAYHGVVEAPQFSLRKGYATAWIQV